MWGWIVKNKLAAGLSAIALASVLASAVDGCSTRRRVKDAIDSAWAWKGAHDAEKKAWVESDKEWEKKVEEAGKRRVVASRPVRPAPTSATDVAAAFRSEFNLDGRVR